jgi:hypothetical protein
VTAGRRWAYFAAALGWAISVAANIAHARIPAHPQAGAVISAAMWPAILFVAVEVLIWNSQVGRRGWAWAALLYGGMAPVAAVAAVVSYRHMSGLLAFYGEDSVTATLGPVAVDGLMVMAATVLSATARHRTDVATAGTVPAREAVPEVVATATPPDVATPVPATPARVATRPRRQVATPDADPAVTVAAARATDPELSQNAVAVATGIPRSTVRRYWDQTTPAPHLTAVREDQP